jgi:hypothetical protein
MDLADLTKVVTPLAPAGKTAEIALLLSCVRADMATEAPLTSLLQPSLDWDYLLTTAQLHGITPLLHQQLTVLPPTLTSELLPEGMAEQLADLFTTNAHYNFAVVGELLHLQKQFQQAEISLLTFKGPVLAQLAYGDWSLRQFVDLDLLVQADQVSRAQDLLLKEGYCSYPLLSKAQLTIYCKLHNQLTYWHPQRQITLDLHWSLLRQHFSYAPSEDFVWQHTAAVHLGHRSVLTLSPEVLVLFLCAHAGQDNWRWLSSLSDIAHLINRCPELDWDWITNHAGQLGTQQMLGLSLCLCHHLLGMPLPSQVEMAIAADSKIIPLAEQVKQQLFTSHINSLPEALTRHRFYLQTMDSWQDRVWYWYDVAFTPNPIDWEMISLPPTLFFLYYPFRLLRMTLKYLFNLKSDER